VKKLFVVLIAGFALMSVLLFQVVAAQQPGHPSNLPRRAIVALVANDAGKPTPVPLQTFPPPPPPGPGYCVPSSLEVPSPPNALFGHFTIGGQPAPAGTLVTLTFDGKPGPNIYTAAPGGYAFFWSAGGQGHNPPCINQVGTEFGFLINGQAVRTGVHVGDPEAYLVFDFDIALP
jgi:hypothetical protein